MQESTLKFLSSTAHSAPVSLHVPLHRTLSAVLAKLVLFPWKDVNDGFLSSLNLNYSEQEVCSKYSTSARVLLMFESLWQLKNLNYLCSATLRCDRDGSPII